MILNPTPSNEYSKSEGNLNYQIHCVEQFRQKEDAKNIKEEPKADNKTSVSMSTDTYRINQKPIVDNIEHYRNIFSTPDNFIKRRVDYSRMKVADEKYRMESERLKSLESFPKHLEHLAGRIAKSGFYYIGNDTDPDKVKCIFCQGILFRWKKTDIPEKEHRKSFPTCPFLLNLNVGNTPIGLSMGNVLIEDPDLKGFSGNLPYNVIQHREIYQMSDDIEFDVDYREKTFEGLDHLKHFSLEGLYIIKKLLVEFLRCYKCQKETELLKGVEHLPREMFHCSNCEYYKIIKNEKFEKENNKGTNDNDGVNTNKVSKNVSSCKIEYSITDDEIDARLDWGLKNKMNILNVDSVKIKRLIEKNLKKTGKDYESIYDLLMDSKTLIEDDENETENNLLEFILPDYTCVVCLDKPIAVVFLPCGHLKTCKSCSNMLSGCPVCRKVIERRVWGVQMSHLKVNE